MRLSTRVYRVGGCLLTLLSAVRALDAAAPQERLAEAQRLLDVGKYEEAQESFEALADDAPPVAIGLARSLESQGKRGKAVEVLTRAAQAHADDAATQAELARLAVDRGEYDDAAVAAALKLDPNRPLAHWVRAELLRLGGKPAEANAEYRWLVDFHNQNQVDDSESLLWIGQAAAQFARWNRLSDQFGYLVNEFYPALLEKNEHCWQAHFETGRLFAEKYNRAEALKAFQAALAINPRAAEVHVALGQLSLEEFEVAAAQAACQRALEINGELLSAWHLQADIHLANFEPRQSAGVLRDALRLQPKSEETLGRMAAAYLAVDGVAQTAADTRFGKLAAEVNARNEHAGAFFESLADALDRLRRWPAAAQYYQEAVTRLPQQVGPPGKLGMMLMRLGEEERARQVLETAFAADPFNVRVKNSLAVLEVLDGYVTLETEHFRIKYADTDRVLASYMGAWLEEVYPQLVRQMGFAPAEKSLFEVFSRARNTDGHGWFSARMVGLPHIHPIGACAGKIVALQSPSEGRQRFNWARVLKHEFVHVINLQQTDFNIPHWFTEALAVLNEGYPRPESWNQLLAEHAAAGKLFNLDNINLGFIRAHSSAEWNLAYCQAELYAQYMLERFGDDAIAKMLAGYAQNLTTPEALRQAFAVEVVDFERGYREYVDKVIAPSQPASGERELNLAQLQEEVARHPQDATLRARLAQAQLGRRGYAAARRSADAALQLDPNCGLAHYVRARLHLLVGEHQEALARLEGALDRQHPQENLLGLLAGLKLKSQDYAAAAELYELGAKQDPQGTKWQKALAAVYLKSGDEKKLADVLTRLAEADPDDLPVRKKLVQLKLTAHDAPAAAHWATDALHIDVSDVELHEGLADARAAQGQHAAAAVELAIAVELEPDEPRLRLALAQAQLKAGDKPRAKQTLQSWLERNPDDARAKEVLESLE